MDVLFVEYPKCSTCKRAKKWLDEHGVAYTDRHIVEDRPTAAELGAWRELAGVPMRRLFNTSGAKYRELGVKAKLDAGMSDEEAFRLLAADGMLVKRPVLVVRADDGTGTAIFSFRDPSAWAAALGIAESEA
ncbi:Spx/MgsR family RNA polymerase-binding regulatory protein [uncultured Parolsenella sp.]|uniref:arsenate reductase family protein n=1 Tax=uncultured Parolsenella sp. TaxID=2083008 RepID=UPI0027D9A5F8|nr:Spx/MgsR family RNA polymerase-binding regulatory protein [uncultured Parolsenella sp.]